MRRKGAKEVLVLLGVLIAAILLLPVAAISLRGMKEDVFIADIAVVLGNEVYADGTPAPRLAARLDRAAELYGQGICKKIIVSGGVGKSGFDEAAGMKRYLAAKSIPSDDVVEDGLGVNTRATADFTARYMNANGFDSVIAVTQFFHVPRSVMTLKSYGIARVGSAYARFFEPRDILSTLREIPALFAYSMGLK
jgi:vancomycin permeability regulator SanA